MPIGIPLWKINTVQKRSFFFGPKISSKSGRGCNRRPPISSKRFLEIQATIECRSALKRARDMKRTYSQTNSSNKYVKQPLLSCII